jgi:RNA polymerase II-associated protein 2
MSAQAPAPTQDSQARATALRHALKIEEQKNLQDEVLDLILEAYDLPTQPGATPPDASDSDVRHFKSCLRLFRPSDFDDLVRERNIDDRCGYALCSNPNKKLDRGGNKVWNRKSGPDFRLVDRAELERWCSDECGERAAFVRAQLSSEPAWQRNSQNDRIKLLDEMRKTANLITALQVSCLHIHHDSISDCFFLGIDHCRLQ